VFSDANATLLIYHEIIYYYMKGVQSNSGFGFVLPKYLLVDSQKTKLNHSNLKL
jgi:hypothetical protein